MSTRIQNGTAEAHGKTWPLYERNGFRVETSVVVDSPESAEALKAQLEAVLSQYEGAVGCYSILILEMSPEDQAEKEELDRRALAA